MNKSQTLGPQSKASPNQADAGKVKNYNRQKYENKQKENQNKIINNDDGRTTSRASDRARSTSTTPACSFERRGRRKATMPWPGRCRRREAARPRRTRRGTRL